MEHIGVLTSGGDAPGMNAAIRAVVRAALGRGLRVTGIRRGYAGLLDDAFEVLDNRSVGNIIHRGGTMLGTSRSPEFRTDEGLARAVEILRRRAVDGLVLVGGDGTFRGGAALMEAGGPPCVGVPGTIDNDVAGTDYTIGFDTAVNTALDAVDRIRDTAASLELLHFVEVMGRRSGAIALAAGAAGGAETVALPERHTDVERVVERIRDDLARGKRGVIVVVAEGEEKGGARPLAAEVSTRLGLDYRVTILGHVQRGGAPTAADRILASRLGAEAVDALVAGKHGCMVGIRGGEIAWTPFSETTPTEPMLDEHLFRLIPLLA